MSDIKKRSASFRIFYSCVSQSSAKRLKIRHEKGVRIVFCSILKSGIRITYSTDKTIDPHRFCYISSQLRQGISNRCRCYCQPYLRGISNLRSLTLEDKISITPFVMLIPSANSLASVNQVQSYEKMLLVGLSGIMFFLHEVTNFSFTAEEQLASNKHSAHTEIV